MTTSPFPRSRRIVALAAAALVAGLGFVAAAPTGASAAPIVAGAEQDSYEAQIVALTNEARATGRTCGDKRMKAAGPVVWNDKLGTSADGHSADMAANGYFAHNDLAGRSPFTRIKATGYKYKAAGENIAAGSALTDPAATVAAWLNSPAHCKVLMNAKYTQLGVGHVEGGSYRIYVTQNFGRPAK